MNAAAESYGFAEVVGHGHHKPVTHVIYSHRHTDHIDAASVFGTDVEIVAHEITKELLDQFADPNRPASMLTFDKEHTLTVGGVTLESSYKVASRGAGNIFIYAPAQKVLTVIDIINPGSTAFMRGDADTIKAMIEYFQDVLDGARAAVDRFSRSDALTSILDGAGWERIFAGAENRINMMANFATKYVLEKESSNGQLWSERLTGVTAQTMHHAYTALESICLRDENPPPLLT